MEITIVVLVFVILMLISYLFMQKKEIRRLAQSLKTILETDTNHLLHVETSDKDVKALSKEINDLVKYIKTKEVIISQKNEALKKGITNITHDFRTPLTSSLGYIDLVLHDNITKEEKQKDLKIIQARLLRLSELINNFFEYSKTISNKEKQNLTSINVIDLLEERIIFFYEDFHNQNRKIELDKPNEKIMMLSNRNMLSRIFDNLIGNAFKHSNKDLKIQVVQDQTIKIIFRNKIDNYDLDVDRIFDEFYISDISRTKGNTGLGLAIVKDFTELLDGRVVANIKEDILNIEIVFKSI